MPSKPKSKCRCWTFTWNNYDPSKLLELEQSFIDKSLDYVFQEEIGEQEGTPHIQGVIRYPNPVASAPIDEYKEFGFHWARCRSWRKSILYCSKLQTRSGKTFTNLPIKIRKKPRDPMDGKKPYKWQQEIMDLVKTEPDDRSIHWYWEPTGCSGKTAMCKHLTQKYNAIGSGGTHKDAKFAIVTALEKEKNVDIVILNIPREARNHVSYRGLEEVKDGWFFSPKYKSVTVDYDPPHVIVFANFPPIVDKLSEDRWIIRRIVKE